MSKEIITKFFAVFLVGILSTGVHARIVNSINFTGVDKKFDTEAEYRLLNLAISIVEARRADTDLSLAVKQAYGSSILGDRASHDLHLKRAKVAATNLKVSWSEVGRESNEMQLWLEGRLRPEYAKAFKKVALDYQQLQNRLVSEGASSDYMKWAFSEISSMYSQEGSTNESAIIQCFKVLEKLAKENIESVSSFESAMEEASNTEDFIKNGLYGHIFDYIAIKADKPKIFIEDEKFFTGVVKFDIFYEALEQISREAHKHVPGTHDLVFSTFDLNFTPLDVTKAK